MANAALNRALRRLVRTIRKFEPGYARAVDEQDHAWMKQQFVPMVRAVMKDIVHLCEVAAEASDEDAEAVRDTVEGAVLFMLPLAQMIGNHDVYNDLLAALNEMR